MTTRTAVFAAADERFQSSARPAPFESSRSRRWAALLDRIAEGDLDACGTFYDESSQLTFSLVMQVVQDRDIAEDLLVDLYVDIRDRAQRGEHRRRNPLSWVIELAQGAGLSRPAPRLAAPPVPVTPNIREPRAVWELAVGSWKCFFGGWVAT